MSRPRATNRVTVLAPDFATFVDGLVGNETFRDGGA